MKLRSIVVVIVLLSVSAFAQELNTIPKYIANKRIFVETSQQMENKGVTKYITNHKASSMIEMSSSANIYSVYYAFIQPLSYNQDANLLMFMHRGNPAVGIGKTKSDIVATYSSDAGQSWSDMIVTSDTSKKNRHPSGVIFNPGHSNDYTKTTAVFCGPVTDEINWTENFFGSINLDKSKQTCEYKKIPDQVAMQGLTVCDDSIAHVLGIKIDTNAQGEGIQVSTVINNGKLDSVTNSFIWTSQILTPNWPRDKNGKIIFPSSSNQAWSTDGKIGYIFFIGVDSTIDLNSPQPIVYKSLDKGESWKRLPSFNFATLNNISKMLFGTKKDTSIKKPVFTDETIDGEVDYNGNLHLFSQIIERMSVSPDSVDFYYRRLLLFDVFMKNDSVWDASVITLLRTLAVSENDKVYGVGTEFLAWDHRLQMSKTRDGKKIFFIWSDSDADPLTATISWDNVGYINNLPNLYGYCKDIENKLETYITEYTSNSDAAYISFWHYVSDYVNETTYGYQLPVVITPILDPYSINPDKPVVHYYLPNINFLHVNFLHQSVINQEAATVGITTYPNPFHSQTTLQLTLHQSESVVMSVYDLSGRLMDEVNYGKLSAGNHSLGYNRNNLSNGLYLYSVKSTTNTYTGKFIVN